MIYVTFINATYCSDTTHSVVN